MNDLIIDPFSDFWSDSQLRLIFKEEYEEDTASNIMWALILYNHPSSKYYTLDFQSRKDLIEKDYLKSPLDWESFKTTVDKIVKFLLSKPKQLLHGWELKLEERDAFMHSRPYDEDNYEMLDKMLAATSKMWDSYFSVQKKVTSEGESTTHGDTELSLSEKGII